MSEKNWGGYQYKGEVPVKEIKPKARKDTKRWCKGKVGREHQVEIQMVHNYGVIRSCATSPSWWRSGWWCYHWQVCAECGKHLRKVASEDCPDLAKKA